MYYMRMLHEYITYVHYIYIRCVHYMCFSCIYVFIICNFYRCIRYTTHVYYMTILQRERNVLFNDALNTFYLQLYGIRHMVKDHSDSEKGNPCRHIGYSYRLTARVLLYAPSHRQDSTYHGLCYRLLHVYYTST